MYISRMSEAFLERGHRCILEHPSAGNSCSCLTSAHGDSYNQPWHFLHRFDKLQQRVYRSLDAEISLRLHGPFPTFLLSSASARQVPKPETWQAFCTLPFPPFPTPPRSPDSGMSPKVIHFCHTPCYCPSQV